MKASFATRTDIPDVEQIFDLTRRLSALLAIAPRNLQRRFVLPQPDGDGTVWLARQLYERRRRKEAMFAQYGRVFSDPAWDVLLDLFIARAEQREVSASAACIGACAPSTTALRCMAKLEKKGLINTKPHPKDGRIRLVELTDQAVSLLKNYLGEGP